MCRLEEVNLTLTAICTAAQSIQTVHWQWKLGDITVQTQKNNVIFTNSPITDTRTHHLIVMHLNLNSKIFQLFIQKHKLQKLHVLQILMLYFILAINCRVANNYFRI